MACSYSLRPLRTVPNLIPSCIKILKEEWPHCKAHILPALVKQELTPVPCSYGLIRHPDDARDTDNLVGHLRFIPVTNRLQAVYGEGFCVKTNARERGIGGKALIKMEELLLKLGYREICCGTYAHMKEYFLRRSYRTCDKPFHTLGANLLHTVRPEAGKPVFVSWQGNVLYPGWESEYEGGVIATEEQMTRTDTYAWFVKHLSY